MTRAGRLRHAWSASLVLAGACLALASCRGAAPEDGAAAPAPVETTKQRGPVSVRVAVDDGTVSVGELLRLTIEARAESGVEVVLPAAPADDEPYGAFEVVGTSTPPDVPEETGRRWRHTWTLRTFESGSHDLPPLTVAFSDRRDAEPIEGELITDPITVEVASLVGEALQAAELPVLLEAEPREVKSFVEVPTEPSAWPLLAGVGLHVLVVLGTLIWLAVYLARGPAAQRVEPPVPAEAWARAQLDALEREDLVGHEQRHEFFFRLSYIVRQYIERRFGLAAPEQTTPEFIASMRRSPVLETRHQERLGEFLRAADLVKFARHRPATTECEAGLVTARAFVDETTPREAADAGRGTAAPGREAAA